MELKDYLLIFKRRWVLFVFVITVILGCEILLLYRESDRYRASARVLLDTANPQELVLSRLTGDSPSRYVTISTRLALLQSIRTAEVAIEILRGQRNIPERPSETPEERQRNPFARLSEAQRAQRMLLYGEANILPQDILADLSVEQSPETTMVDVVSITDRMETSVDFANAMTAALQVRVQEIIMTRILDAIVMTQSKLDVATADAEAQRASLAALRSQLGLESNLVGFTEQLRVLLQGRETLQSQLTSLRAERTALETERKSITDEPVEYPPPEPVRSDVLSSLLSQITAAELQLGDLRLRFTEEHATVRALEARLESLRSRAQQEKMLITPEVTARNEAANEKVRAARQRVVDAKDAGLRRVGEHIADLEKQIAARDEEIRKVQERATQYLTEERKALAAETKVQELQKLLEELQTKKELVPEYVTVERWANATEGERLEKKGEQQIYFVVLIALFTAGGLVYLVDYLDTTVRNSTDVKKYLNLPLLCSVPRISDKSKLLSQIPLKSPLVEIFGRLATLLLSMLERQGGKTLLVTSVTKREGKSTLSANLAIAIARVGRKVALLDCDMRRPVLHHYFGLDNTTGMSTYLEGKVEAREALAAVREGKPEEAPKAEGLEILDEPPEIAPVAEGEEPAPGGVPHMEPGDLRARDAMGAAGAEIGRAEDVQAIAPDIESILMPSGVPNLWVLPSGPTPANPIALLESDRMDALLAVLRNSMDIVIIDSPPLDSTADPLTLSTRVDGCVLVTMSGEVRRHQVTWAKRMLQDLEANIMGVVLNMCSVESKAYYYYYTRDPDKSFRDHE